MCLYILEQFSNLLRKNKKKAAKFKQKKLENNQFSNGTPVYFVYRSRSGQFADPVVQFLYFFLDTVNIMGEHFLHALE